MDPLDKGPAILWVLAVWINKNDSASNLSCVDWGGGNLLGGETLDCTSIAHEGDMDRLGQWIGPVI